MLHLVYTMRLTRKARENVADFWSWVRERQLWFYEGLSMVNEVHTYQCIVGPDVYTIEHWVSFNDEKAWGEYRRTIAQRRQAPEWERRRVSQDQWWEITQARILTDQPAQ